MSLSLLHRRQLLKTHHLSALTVKKFRSNAALEALSKATENITPNIALYNYPSFSGAYSALFARIFHSRLNRPCLVLPFSSVEPLSYARDMDFGGGDVWICCLDAHFTRVDDLCFEGLEKCYLLDFIGPKEFAREISRKTSCEVFAFDHRKSVLPQIASDLGCGQKVMYHVDINKSSSTAAYEYFSSELSKIKSCDGEFVSLLNPEDQDRVELILKYIEDTDLRQWNLPNIKAFNSGLHEWRLKLNCITYPNIFEQLLKLGSEELIDTGNSYISTRQVAAKELLNKVFKLHLGRGFYGECLGVRADGNGHLNDEIGKELSIKSAQAGLRPIGAVIYMQRNNLKMSLRTMDTATDTSEVAKAYGGGGSPSSSSFIIRMDEYNQWLPLNQPRRQ